MSDSFIIILSWSLIDVIIFCSVGLNYLSPNPLVFRALLSPTRSSSHFLVTKREVSLIFSSVIPHVGHFFGIEYDSINVSLCLSFSAWSLSFASLPHLTQPLSCPAFVMVRLKLFLSHSWPLWRMGDQVILSYGDSLLRGRDVELLKVSASGFAPVKLIYFSVLAGSIGWLGSPSLLIFPIHRHRIGLTMPS